MKILFLTDEFYPNFGANSLLIKTLAGEFVKNKHQVFVMPFTYNDGLPVEECWNGIDVVRKIPHDNKKTLFSNLKQGRFLTALKIGWKCLQEKCTKKEKVLRKDRITARECLKNFIKNNHIDVVVSICCSIELSFPLLYLRKKNKLPCKWIFYMIDPFESHNYYRGIEKVSTLRKLQHSIMERCDKVVATSLIYNDVKEWETEEILNKITIVEFPKIKKPVAKSCDDDIVLDKEMINVVCTGSKNEVVRNSVYTLALCEAMKRENVVFHFIGNGWSEEDYEVKGNCIFYKPHTHQAIQNIQTQADFLLNIGNVVVNQLPSKILEYISTGKPIINVVKSNSCPTLALLQEYPALNLFEEKDIQISIEELKTFLTIELNKLDFECINEKYKIYTPEYVIQQMLDVCKE